MKNGIVLYDQTYSELNQDNDNFLAVFDRGRSTAGPGSMAGTAMILGQIFAVFFGLMAITIMAELGFTTLQTFILVPVLFAIIYRIKPSTA